MKIFIKLFFILLILLETSYVLAGEYFYILNDRCITDLFTLAKEHFKDTEIEPLRDSRGLILRLKIEDPVKEYYNLSIDLYKSIENFLAKIKNPAIIEVHAVVFPDVKLHNLKSWEFTTIMANNIESLITVPFGTVEQERINSVGYGEFLPSKNTSNNGGKIFNRVDIIVLCNVSGE